jgi:predicted glycoside hydrolase/deacetylase ChbG (UPF0249 family)
MNEIINKKLLIINADDFGLSREISDCIINCHKNGIVTSTTLMTNMPAAEYACYKVQGVPSLGVGVHLTITEGKPLSDIEKVKDLVDDEGCFLGAAQQKKQLWKSKNIQEQITREIAAQIEKAIDLKIKPTHCDSHHGIHIMPVFRKVLINVLPRYNIHKVRTQVGSHWVTFGNDFCSQARCHLKNLRSIHKRAFRRWNHFLLNKAGIRTPDRKVGWARVIEQLSPKEKLLICLKNLQPGISEMLFHPGYLSQRPAESSRFDLMREIDAQLMLDPDVYSAVKESGIKLISYKEV